MKKIKLSALAFFGCGILSLQMFAQNQQINQLPNAGYSIITNTSPVTNGSQFNQRAVPNNIGNSTLNTAFQQSFSQQTPAGQHTCKTHELNQKHYQERGIQQEFNQGYLNAAQSMANYNAPKTAGINEIAIIFHVVHNPNNPAENVSNALIMQVYNDIVSDFQALNLDPIRSGFGFTAADANINFCLATQTPAGVPLAEIGVNRVATTEDWYNSDNGEENKMKASATGGAQIWNRNNYLNVWICDISNGAGSGTAGYAYRPNPSFLPGATIDGIVLDYNLGMNNENVLTHEIGHYLGLDHTWGGSGGCGVDDGFTDTPVTDGPSFNYPGSCGPSQQTCAGTQTQYENFMDYANCTAMFTQEQANYMLMILQGIRGSLLLSPGCDPTNTPPISAFTSNPSDPTQITIPQNASVSFIDQSTNVPTGWAWTISGTQGVDWAWISSTNQNSQDPVAQFFTVGTYTVSLTASNAFGADLTPAVKNTYVNVAGIAAGNSCDTLRNYIPTNDFYTLTVGAGNIAGNASISGQNILEWAEPYNALSTTKIKGLDFLPNRISNGGGSITFKVYNNASGQPGTVVASEVVPISDFTENQWEHIEFSIPPTVTGQFWVGYELSYASTDTFALYSNYNQTLPTNYTWLKASLAGWNNAGVVFSGSPKFAFVMDVLTSNGTDPVVDFNTTSNEICVGGDIAVDGSISTDVNSYQWYVTNNPVVGILQSSTSSSNIFNFPYAPGNYNVYLFGSGSCVSPGVVMPVTIFSDITATVTPTATTCGNNNGIITITAPTGGGSSSYYYSIDGVNFQSSNVFNNLAAGSYTVYIGSEDGAVPGYLGSGCITSYVRVVGTSSPISPTISANTSVCPGGSATITAGGGTGYAWYNGASLIASSASTSVTPATTTQYSCVVTSGACSATVYTTVTVRTPPTAPTITPSGATTFCAGQDVDLTSSYPTGNTWSTTQTSSTITVSTAGPFTVTHTDGFGCVSTASAPVSITVNPIPTIASGTVSNPSSCATATGSIQVTGTGIGNISWTGTATGSATGVALPYVIPTLAAGSYNITFTSGGCTSNTLNVALNDPTPPATPTISAGGPTTFCSGGSVTLTSSQGSGNTWSTTATTASINVTTGGNYSVTYTDGFGCSATSAPINVVVNNNPTAPTITAGGSTTFCAGGSVNLTSSQGSGNTWSANAGSATTQTVPVTASGSYTVTFTNGNGCSATSAATVVTVNPLPVITEGTLTSPSTCGTATGSIQVNGSGTGDISWSGTATGSANGVTLPYTIPNLVAGSYSITFEDGNGCTSTSLNSSISDPTPPTTPTISVTGSLTFCAGGSVLLTSSQTSGNTWSANAGSATTQQVTATTAGSYIVTYTDGNGCSATSAPTVVTVNPLPTVTQSALGTVCVYNPSMALTGGLPTGGTYSGTGVTAGNFDPATAGNGTHTITYTYEDGNNCVNTATADIIVDGCLSITESDLTNVKVYPNPTENKLTIELSGDFNYEITDTKGRIIEKGEGNNSSNVNTSNYTSGVYFVNLVSEKVNTTIRVVKN